MKKKLTNLWNNLTKAKVKPLVVKNPEKGNCDVIMVNDDADDLVDALGVTDERYEELGNAVIAYIKENPEAGNDIGERIRYASTLCKHPNELALVAFTLGRGYESEMRMKGFLKVFMGGPHGPAQQG